MKFKKILIHFLLENSFYSVEEFVTIEPWSVKIVLVMYFTLHVHCICMLHWLVLYVLYKYISDILISCIITSIINSFMMCLLSFSVMIYRMKQQQQLIMA